MHNRYKADPGINIFSDINAFFAHSLDIADKAGIAPRQDRARSRHRLRQDAGAEHQRDRQARRIQALRPPLLIGASRKRFIEHVSPSGPTERIGGSLAAHLLAVINGANIIRTHDVAETVQAIRVAMAIRSAK